MDIYDDTQNGKIINGQKLNYDQSQVTNCNRSSRFDRSQIVTSRFYRSTKVYS